MPKSIAGRFSRPNSGRSGHPKTPFPLMGEGWGEGEIAKVNPITVLMRTRSICRCERPSTGSGRAGISMRVNTRLSKHEHYCVIHIHALPAKHLTAKHRTEALL